MQAAEFLELGLCDFGKTLFNARQECALYVAERFLRKRPEEAWHYNHVTFTPIAKNFMLCCRLIYMLSMLYVGLMIKVKVGIPESFKVGWYPQKITGPSHLKLKQYSFHGMPGNILISNSVLFLSIAAVEDNDCHSGELNINDPPPLSATYDRPETSLQSGESLFQQGTSGRKPEPSFIHQHHDSPLETGSGSYSTAETSSQGQYHL